MDFSLPRSAFFEKILPKNTILENFQKTSKSGITELKTELSKNIQKIIWKYKIAESTTGIRKTENILEIQIFEIILKEETIPFHILKTIDTLIPYPIFYILTFEKNFHKKTAYAISLKKFWVENSKSPYLFSDWNEKMNFDFTAITTDNLYENICKKFLEKENEKEDFNKNFSKNHTNNEENPKTENKNLQKIIEHRELKIKLKKEIEMLESKMRKEKNLAKRNEIYLQIKNKTQELRKIL